MRLPAKDRSALDKRFQKVLATPASFAFFVAIHDFVGYIETKVQLEGIELPVKYSQLKQVYQGIEDSLVRSEKDLGHDRYMTIQDLSQIRKENVSDSNPLWKKREAIRGWASDVHKAILESGKEAVAEKV
jgi:hypothetical protein